MTDKRNQKAHTITDKFQATIPLIVRAALKLRPRQRVSYEVRPDGSAVLRPVPSLDDLFGSVKLGRTVATTRGEKAAAREASRKDRKRASPAKVPEGRH
jgi:bifunctional DNA-binding transcriptional regulator/antitoxin component of YhaV-PrlF toxin-antitoxin module